MIMVETDDRLQGEQYRPRELPARIDIPDIRGEMVYLRPATQQDLEKMDAIDAYVNASGLTGKDRVAERAAVHAWVLRSEAWANGTDAGSGIDDPEQRRTIAWSLMTTTDDCESETVDAQSATEFLGMIFLGKDYRGRGYSRDAMPRVLTYGFAGPPEGLGLHRIWVAVPEKNTRSYSVYQSLGFVPSGVSRHALWDNRLGKYQDLNVLDTLDDEFDPVRAMDAFGMHVITSNPGMEKALSQHEHTLAIRKQQLLAESGAVMEPDAQGDTTDKAGIGERMRSDSKRIAQDAVESENTWPYNSAERNTSKKAWWRTLGHDRMKRRAHTDADDQ